MKKRAIIVALFLCTLPFLAAPGCPNGRDDGSGTTPITFDKPHVAIDTARGRIEIELFDIQTPQTVENFLHYVDEHLFDNTLIHAVSTTDGIRGGLYRRENAAVAKITQRDTLVTNESASGLPNRRGYIAMVAQDNNGKSEFVIYTEDQTSFDYQIDAQTLGRTVFGRVVSGMGLVDGFAAAAVKSETADDGQTLSRLPVDDIVVTSVRQIDEDGNEIPVTLPGQPTIQCPSDVIVDQTGDLTPAELGEATAIDREDGLLTATSDAPADGFPLGTTLVTWSATDSTGRVGRCTQTVRVRGPGRPTIDECPADITGFAVGDLTTISLPTVTGTDAEDGDLTATSDAPADGFPVGETIVTWTATDSDGFTATCTQTVTLNEGEPELVTSDTGVQTQDFIVGNGASAADAVRVSVNYVGTLEDGTEFDSGNDVAFPLSGVIAGFAEGVRGMHVGGKRRIIIPPDQGYGDNPPPSIPPGETITFMVDLVRIVQ